MLSLQAPPHGTSPGRREIQSDRKGDGRTVEEPAASTTTQPSDKSSTPPRRRLPPTDLSRAQEDRRLLPRYPRHGDESAREGLVARLLPLARRMARRYR